MEHHYTVQNIKQINLNTNSISLIVAPEIFAGKGYSYEIDLWALGVIIYELVVGDIPFGFLIYFV